RGAWPKGVGFARKRSHDRARSSWQSLLSIDELPRGSTVEQTNAYGRNRTGLKVTRVDAHSAVFLSHDRFPVRNTTAGAAPDEPQGLLAPGIIACWTTRGT